MKKYISIISIITVFSLFANPLFAQKGVGKLNLQYNYSFPLGNFKNNYVSQGSARGFAGDLSFGLNNKWSLGLGLGFQDYYQKYDRAVYNLAGNKQISAVLSNSIQVIPVLAKATFTPLAQTNSFIQPYVSGGAGVSFVTYNQYLGEFSSYNSSHGNFTAQADAGVMIPLSKNNPNNTVEVGASYNYTKFNQSDASNLNSIGIHAGFIFRLR